jgi:hypothetical protein
MYQARELVAQRNILGDEISTVLEEGSSSGENGCELERHPANDSLSPNAQEESAISPSYRLMTRHRPSEMAISASRLELLGFRWLPARLGITCFNSSRLRECDYAQYEFFGDHDHADRMPYARGL